MPDFRGPLTDVGLSPNHRQRLWDSSISNGEDFPYVNQEATRSIPYYAFSRLNETNPTCLRTLNSNITKSVKCLVNSPRSKESTSAVHPNHSQLTLDLAQIYKSNHYRKSINRAHSPRSRESTSAFHPNHSQLTLDLAPIYKQCQSRKYINRAFLSHEKRHQAK
ncbi:hypothetical protein M5K25_000887 [Dendrobium thyrsiflorum]|uniref:Uncharacterized protein n=1 Tax=Dendrobium thyrsiflorum TaxID=117978 RepID=A0ABD0VVC1_DENTH